MSARQIILDTETTGLRVEDGHRIIEIGCIEMIDRKLTGKKIHYYLNPEREIDAGAIAIHGLKNEFLKDKPFFHAIAKELVDFISDAELIIHNAPFDLSFLNYELTLTQQGWKIVNDYCLIIDTLQIARQLHVGQKNSLDALCKRYRIDNSKRDMHGALLDAHLLAQVYLAMTGGQGSFFDDKGQAQERVKKSEVLATSFAEKYEVVLLKANDDELKEHHLYLEKLLSQGKCLWLDD